MLQVIYTLAPVFITIALGLILTRSGFLSKAFLDDLNQFIYWIGLPLLILKSLATADKFDFENIYLMIIFLVSTGVIVFLSYMAKNYLHIENPSLGTFIQAAFRGNLAFVAIPIILFALYHHPQEQIRKAETLAFITFAPTMLFYNIVSVIVLVKFSNNTEPRSPAKTLWSIVSNPLILASILGLIIYSTDYKMPEFLLNSCSYIGNISGPTALLCVGGAMAHAALKGHQLKSFVASCFKVFLLPLVALVCSLPFNLSEEALFVLLILSASPVATASYVLVKSLKGDEDLSSNSIVMSTVLSIISLSVVISFYTPKLISG